MEGLWIGWCFTIIGMKKLYKIYLDEAYVLSSDSNLCVLLTFKKFQLVSLFQMPP